MSAYTLSDQLKAEQKREKILEIAQYIIDNDATIRNASENLLIPRTTIHNYMRNNLKHISIVYYDQVQIIFRRHYKMRVPRMVAANWKRRHLT